MLIKVNRKELYNNIRLLSGLPSEKTDPFYNKLFMVVDGNNLVLVAGNRTNFVIIYMDTLEADEGECCLSFDIMKMLKVIKDEEITIKVEKRASLKGDKGFKGTLAVIPNISSAYQKIKEYRDSLGTSCITMKAEELESLARISLEFPSYLESRWIDINMGEEGEIYGCIQQNELGSVDYFPLSEVDGNSYAGVGTLLSFDPEMLISQLDFVGNRATISLTNDVKKPVIISDLDNPVWFGLTSLKQKPFRQQEQNDQRTDN